MQSTGKIRQESINRMLEQIDLVELMRNDVEIKRSGSNFMGKCPFHADSTPSMIVDPRHYHCFGCQARGNAIDYEMHRTGAPFPEAVKSLADKFRVELEFEGANSEKDFAADERKRLAHIMAECAGMYARVLQTSHEGKEALAYLRARGFTEEQIRQWDLGLSTANNLVLQLAPEKGWKREDLESLGLVKKNEIRNDFYDFFRARIMIPIKDERGLTVAFGGRIYLSYPPDRTPPKYLNSPETTLFSKSRILFNFHRARATVMQAQSVVVVEGYMDCIALVNAGIPNVVAVLGTALTPDHVKKLGRVTRTAVLCFDSDKAGREATKRSFEMAYPLNLIELQHIAVPQGKDPDEFVRKEGLGAFQQVLNTAEPLIQWVCDYHLAQARTRELQVRAIKSEMVPVILRNPDAAIREVALGFLAQKLGLSSFRALLSVPDARGVGKQLPQSAAPAAFQKSANSADTAPEIPVWGVRGVDELKFVAMLATAQFSDLPLRLKNLLDGLYGDDPLDEKICAQMLSEFMSRSSSEIVRSYLSFFAEQRDRSPLDVDGFAISSDDHLTAANAVVALLKWDLEGMAQSGLERWAMQSGVLSAQGGLKNPNHVFDAQNIPFVRFLLKDIEITKRTGVMKSRLERALLQLELDFLSSQLSKSLGDLRTAPGAQIAGEEQAILEQRCKRILQERERRVQKFTQK